MTQGVEIRIDAHFWRCFSPWGTSFVWAEAVETRFKPACSWFPAEHSKKPVRTRVHPVRPRAVLPSLSLAELPAGSSASPALWSSDEFCLLPMLCPGMLPALGLGTPLGIYCICRTSYHSKKHYLLIPLQLHKSFSPTNSFSSLDEDGNDRRWWLQVPWHSFPSSDLDNAPQLWGEGRLDFFCLFVLIPKAGNCEFNPWTV